MLTCARRMKSSLKKATTDFSFLCVWEPAEPRVCRAAECPGVSSPPRGKLLIEGSCEGGNEF